MSSVRVFSAAVLGLDALPVEVEVDSTPGLHFFNIVGLPDKAVQESKDRIAAAIKNSGFIAPSQKNRRIIVNLAPADVKKAGPAYDLPIALGYLLTTQQLKFISNGRVFLGELSLDGAARRVSGILPAAFMARKQGFTEIVVPAENAAEAAVVQGLQVIGVKNLKQLCTYLTGQATIVPTQNLDYASHYQVDDQTIAFPLDLADIKGQAIAKRALLIAAAGGHNLLLYGSPGSGKTLLAQVLPTILPPMNYDEALEVTKIYSVSGLIGQESIISRRPFRNPHHTTSAVAVIGGGSWPRPGEISLAHRGVLFLDELPEFPRNVVEALRQPMESGTVVVSRAASSVQFPARFMLVAAMNPCPCGNYGDEVKACICPAGAVYRYQRKISGPVLDRIDLQINVPRETYERISGDSKEIPSHVVRAQVLAARQRQQARFGAGGILLNSAMGPREIKKYCQLEPAAEALLKQVVTSKNLSGRGYHKLLKIARTIADLAATEVISRDHLSEAVTYRIKSGDDVIVG